MTTNNAVDVPRRISLADARDTLKGIRLAIGMMGTLRERQFFCMNILAAKYAGSSIQEIKQVVVDYVNEYNAENQVVPATEYLFMYNGGICPITARSAEEAKAEFFKMPRHKDLSEKVVLLPNPWTITINHPRVFYGVSKLDVENKLSLDVYFTYNNDKFQVKFTMYSWQSVVDLYIKVIDWIKFNNILYEQFGAFTLSINGTRELPCVSVRLGFFCMYLDKDAIEKKIPVFNHHPDDEPNHYRIYVNPHPSKLPK